MNSRHLSAYRLGVLTPTRLERLSRREFVRASGSAALAGAVLGTGLLRPRILQAANPDDPLPLPGGTPALGGAFHVFAPGAFDPIDAEPITITNFNGAVGLAYIDGTVTRTQISTGRQDQLPFTASDMRFMQGVYRSADGKPRQGTFGFI